MINSGKFSENKLYRIILCLLQPGILAFGAVVVLYTLIFWSVNKGVSIDEGYYLLGYLKDQALGPNTTDLHRIVRTIFFFIPEDNVLALRWTRVILTVVLLFLFLWSSYQWIEKEYKISFNKLPYYSMGMLSGSMCFAYASPVIYYDNLQLIIYLLIFSLFFQSGISSSTIQKNLWLIIIGIIAVIGLANYFTSGFFLLLVILLLVGLYALPEWKKILISWLFVATGLLIGIILYSIFINDFFAFVEEAFLAYSKFATNPKAKYDIDGQWLVIGKYFLGMAKVYIPIFGLCLVYFFLRHKKYINIILLNIIFGAILLILAYKYSIYYSNILLLPIVLICIDTAIHLIHNKQRFKFSKNHLFVLILLVLPLLAVSGSNQRLEMKMVYFMPFWFLAYFILLAEFKKHLESPRINTWHMVFIMIFFVVFSAQGFLKHIHYNYSIKRSTHLVKNAERFTNIGVSEYQCRFYENGIGQLRKAGFKEGDEVLAFFETYMLVYMAGGYVPHRLSYSADFFVLNEDNIPKEKVKFIIIDESEIELISEFLSGTNWGFPKSYKRIDLGTDGHNLTQLGFNYILYSANP